MRGMNSVVPEREKLCTGVAAQAWLKIRWSSWIQQAASP